MALLSLSASIPSTLELCCVEAQIDVSEVRDSSAKSNFHWKTMKCRLIIHTMQDNVIACPIFETIGSIHVITSVNYFNGESFRKTLKDINVTWSTPRLVTPDVYANCLRYSIQFAMAPLWNRVGSYLINDADFLSRFDNSAVKFNLTIQRGCENTTTESILKVEPVRVHLTEFELEELNIPGEVIAHFMADPKGILDVTPLGSHRVTVLPSLKRGRLLTVLKYIPPTCPFKNYNELRRHWKNMYGYRLPKSDQGMIYYDVYFPMPDENRFLYPHLCVRSQISDRAHLGNPELPIRAFLQDLSERMPLVCGQRFEITIKKRESSETFLDENQPGPSHLSYMTPSRLESFCRNLNETSRLSLSSRHQLVRKASELMSPTPSLCGNSAFVTRYPKFRKALTILDGDSDKKPISRPSDEEIPPEIQNRCPNDNPIFFREKSAETVSKTSSKVDDFSGVPPKVPRMMNKPEIMKIPTIVKDDVLSKYFEKMREGRQKICENIALLEERSLSQKLERNMNSMETKNTNSLNSDNSHEPTTPSGNRLIKGPLDKLRKRARTSPC